MFSTLRWLFIQSDWSSSEICTTLALYFIHVHISVTYLDLSFLVSSNQQHPWDPSPIPIYCFTICSWQLSLVCVCVCVSLSVHKTRIFIAALFIISLKLEIPLIRNVFINQSPKPLFKRITISVTFMKWKTMQSKIRGTNK